MESDVEFGCLSENVVHTSGPAVGAMLCFSLLLNKMSDAEIFRFRVCLFARS